MGPTLWLIVICVALFIAYRIGKWEDQWRVEILQADNTRLTGEIYRMSREIMRGDYLAGKKLPVSIINGLEDDIEELEDIKWE